MCLKHVSGIKHTQLLLTLKNRVCSYIYLHHIIYINYDKKLHFPNDLLECMCVSISRYHMYSNYFVTRSSFDVVRDIDTWHC